VALYERAEQALSCMADIRLKNGNLCTRILHAAEVQAMVATPVNHEDR
jgi:hypothetical protein